MHCPRSTSAWALRFLCATRTTTWSTSFSAMSVKIIVDDAHSGSVVPLATIVWSTSAAHRTMPNGLQSPPSTSRRSRAATTLISKRSFTSAIVVPFFRCESTRGRRFEAVDAPRAGRAASAKNDGGARRGSPPG